MKKYRKRLLQFSSTPPPPAPPPSDSSDNLTAAEETCFSGKYYFLKHVFKKFHSIDMFPDNGKSSSKASRGICVKRAFVNVGPCNKTLLFSRALERSMSVSRSSGFCPERERAWSAQIFSSLTLRFTFLKIFNFC